MAYLEQFKSIPEFNDGIKPKRDEQHLVDMPDAYLQNDYINYLDYEDQERLKLQLMSDMRDYKFRTIDQQHSVADI